MGLRPGLENDEIAEVMKLSLASIKRDWTLARAWLYREARVQRLLGPPAGAVMAWS